MRYNNNEEPVFDIKTEVFDIIDNVKGYLNTEDWIGLTAFINIKEKYILENMPKDDPAETYVDNLLKKLS